MCQAAGRSSDFAADHRAPRNDGGFAVEDVKRVGFFVMNFHLTGCLRRFMEAERSGAVTRVPPLATFS